MDKKVKISDTLTKLLAKSRLTDREHALGLKSIYNHKPKLSTDKQIELRDKLAAKHLVRKETKVAAKRVDNTLKEFAKLKAREFILESIGGQDALFALVTKIYQQAKRGSYKHQELLMNYLLGKPVDRIQLEATNGNGILPSPPVVKIIADTIRLDKLNKDASSAKENGISDDRIKEMENILNKEVDGK